LTDAYIDPEEDAFVRELTDQLATGIGLPRGSAHDRAGVLLGRALLRSGDDGPDGGEPDGEGSDGEEEPGFDAAAALGGFAQAGMLSLDGGPGDAAGAADAVVVLAPAEPFAADAEAYTASQGSGAEESTGSRSMLDTAGALHGVAETAVLVGGPSAARPGGLVHQARAEGAAYSTVDAAG
ncbi:copper transporter, partial [Streptomonospora algeriensis]